MTGILFIKTSSLGDVVHQMPAVTDAARNQPGRRMAWVVEEAFAPLARLHPAIADVIPVATRRWRKQLARRSTWREIGDFATTLREGEFDQVIDTQGLIRSALDGAGGASANATATTPTASASRSRRNSTMSTTR